MKSLPTPFPAASFIVKTEHSAFRSENASRRDPPPAAAAEMSDGTLRFCASPSRCSVRARRRFWRSMNRRTACIATCFARAGPADYRGLALQPDLADQPLGGAGRAYRRRAPCQRYALENRGGETRIVE